jgi:hypothetical protein
MRQQADQQGADSIGADLLGMIGAIAGSSFAYLITSHLAKLESVVACAMIISFSVFASTRRSQPLLWWASLGAIAGGIGGTGSVLGNYIPQIDLPDKETIRYQIIGFFSITGFVSGIILGRNIHKENVRHPKDFIRGASALTTSIFAVLVTLQFTAKGIDAARTLSSKLSVSTTILVASLTIPGWVGYQLSRPRVLVKKLLSHDP